MDSIDPCPLCADTKGEHVWSVPYADVWTALERQWEVVFDPSVTAPYDRAGTARLYRCDTCGLHYFSPLLPGSAAFYDQLSENPRYYVSDRWEFGVVASRLSPNDQLIDFGAGSGVFIRRVAPMIAQAVGVDHNPRATAGAPEQDAVVLNLSFREVADRFPGHFDVATAFHVLEHIDSAAAVCEPAVTALRPGGVLFLSTPNNERTVRRRLEPLDCPPHHVSRWSAEQYRYLAQQFGLRLVAVHREPFVNRQGRPLRHLGVPERAVQAAGLLAARMAGLGIASRGPLARGTGPDHWPIGTDILVELRKA